MLHDDVNYSPRIDALGFSGCGLLSLLRSSLDRQKVFMNLSRCLLEVWIFYKEEIRPDRVVYSKS
jgi:hypothetical protein